MFLLVLLINLEELYLSGNSYDKIELNMPAYESLRLLQLTENKFEDWSCILKIDKVFPKLCTLILAHNKISTCGKLLQKLFERSVEDNETAFRHLQVLNMNNTFISEWDELGKLSVIKSVADIRLHSIPLVQVLYCSSKPSGRFLCLKGLNGNENSDGNSCYRKSFLNTAN
ncbi:TBCEL [Bugula neritina]|uniref:TBCEL n=1 Tax=Bugula neritina TaxID=10212 RepID=A0A7J7IYZ2_BUGNE|nr:TBCEL [Bugula neritina]